MKPTTEIAKPILATMKQRPGTGIFRVAIDGYPGSGKTTLAQHLSQKTGGRVIHQDDYLLPLADRLRLIEQSSDLNQTVIFDFYDAQKLLQEIQSHQEPPTSHILFIDGVFLLDRAKFPDGWDFSVYLSGDWDTTDQRRVQREKKRWGSNYMSESDPRSLFPKITRVYRDWARNSQPENFADLVISID